jgi:hypothetical protein
MPTLVVNSSARAFNDPRVSANPLRRNFDWARASTLTVKNPKSFADLIEAGGAHNVFNGARATSADNTTAWTVTGASASDPSRYRFAATAGTAPALRADRGLSLSGVAVTVALNADQTATFSLGSGSFGSAVTGDVLFAPGPTTGDPATAFSPLNEGFWTIIAVLSSTSVQVQRTSGASLSAPASFSGASEVVTLGSAAQLQAFSAAGVQAGDRVNVSAASPSRPAAPSRWTG